MQKGLEKIMVLHQQACTLLDLAQWNLNSFEFKFDDTRLSSWYKNKIGPIKKKMLRPDVALTLLAVPVQKS